MPKFPTRRNSNRIPQHDYSTQGYYFVTICVENRQQIFGAVENNRMILNDVGNMINSWWQEMFKKYDNISIDEYIIMPNHIHGIINIVGADLCVCPIQNDKIYDNHNGRTHRSAPTISNIIQWFKTMTTFCYNKKINKNRSTTKNTKYTKKYKIKSEEKINQK